MPGTSGSPDTVDIGFRVDRHVEIDHMADLVDIDASRGDIRGDEHRDPTSPEGVHRLGPGILGLVAVNCVGIDRCSAEDGRKTICAVLGSREHQRPGDLGTTKETRQQILLRIPVDLVELLRDCLDRRRFGIGLDRDRIPEDRVRQHPDLLRQGCREEQSLAFIGEHRNDLANVVDETHVQHSIGFIKHERLDLGEIDVSLVHQVEKSAGRGDQHVDPRSQGLDLVVLTDTTEDHCMLQRQFPAIGDEALHDLHREFTRGAEHECTRRTALGALARRSGLSHFGTGEPVQDRQCEGAGLAGTRLGATKNVATFDGRRNGVSLNWSRLGVALGFNRANDGLRKPEILETHAE